MLRSRLGRSPRVTASIVPWMGTISGATIIAPMTVAVESPTTPAAAMTEASVTTIQNRDRRRGASGPSKKTVSRTVATSCNPSIGTGRVLAETMPTPRGSWGLTLTLRPRFTVAPCE
jgi:hypothetical protein